MGIRSIGKSIMSAFNFGTTITLNNHKFRIPIIKNMGLPNVSLKEEWISHLFRLLQLNENSSFIDIGVNVGQTLLKFRSNYEIPYWGFEPNPSCVFYVQALIRANHFKKVNIIPVGLSSENGLGKFFLKNDVDASGTIVQDLRPDFYQQGDVEYVPLFSFDSLLLPEIGTISLIKIDVEGAELDVISGMRQAIKEHQPFIICEILDYHSEKSKESSQNRANKLVDIMHSLGYDIFRIKHNGNNLSFDRIQAVELTQWVPESWDRNDYLFAPKGKSGILKTL